LGSQPQQQQTNQSQSNQNAHTEDMFGFSNNATPTNNRPNNDFENLFGPTPTNTAPPKQRSPVNTPTNINTPLSKDEEEELKRQIEPGIHVRVETWAGNKKSNLRSLISALHTILWEDSGWQEAPLSELVQPGALKKYYRKAIVIVHPDKTTGKSTEIKVLATQLFEVLSEAAKTAQW